MRTVIFYLKQLLPFMYWSEYRGLDNKRHLSIWRQWFGRPFNIRQFDLAD